MRPGETWFLDVLDHKEFDGETAWQDVDKLNMQPPLVRFVGYIAKVSKHSVAISVNFSEGQTTTPMLLLRSAIVNSGKISLPPKRRKPAGTPVA